MLIICFFRPKSRPVNFSDVPIQNFVRFQYQQNYRFPIRFPIVLVDSFTFCHVLVLLLLVRLVWKGNKCHEIPGWEQNNATRV